MLLEESNENKPPKLLTKNLNGADDVLELHTHRLLR